MKKLLKYVTIICVVSAIVAIAGVTYAVSTTDLVKQYTEIAKSRQGYSKAIFELVTLPDGTVLVRSVLPTINNVELPDSDIKYGGGGEKDEEDPPPPGDEDVIIDGWLLLHKDPSGTGGSLDTGAKSTVLYDSGKWLMGEGASTAVNSYMRGLYTDSSCQRPNLTGTPASQGMVNASGRYWVAIGPAYFNSAGIGSDGMPKGCDFTYAPSWFADGTGHNFDVKITYNGSTYYIYCCMGDSKAHTFSDGKGYIQSGYNQYGNFASKNRDSSIVEFCGVDAGAVTGLTSSIGFQGILKY